MLSFKGIKSYIKKWPLFSEMIPISSPLLHHTHTLMLNQLFTHALSMYMYICTHMTMYTYTHLYPSYFWCISKYIVDISVPLFSFWDKIYTWNEMYKALVYNLLSFVKCIHHYNSKLQPRHRTVVLYLQLPSAHLERMLQYRMMAPLSELLIN